MANTYGISEIVGTSPDGTDAAIRSALDRAGETIRNIDWFEVTEIRGHADEERVLHFQVTLKVGFRLESPAAT